MRIFKKNLDKQLLSIVLVIFLIILTSLYFLLPKLLFPIYEKNIYEYLKQPLSFINDDTLENKIENNIAYIYITDNSTRISKNFLEIINTTPKKLLKRINKPYGNFIYKGTKYYYYTSYDEYELKISITNDNYVHEIREDILSKIIPVLFITLVIISGLLIAWSRRLVMKIEYLKKKIDNIDSDDYETKYQYHFDDELKILSDAIDNMHLNLIKEEEYKNQMYQNISHDFKTPITVMKSYLEAFDDNMIDSEQTKKVIKEQLENLELKVHSLLYLNKLDYLKEMDDLSTEKIDIVPIIKSSMEKFKFHRSDLNWKLIVKDKNTIYNGTKDIWETIVDNFFNNFIRYANKNIKITIKNNTINFYNDGDPIDDKIFDQIFTPYKKGIKGQFGLGLSIIKKSVDLCGYKISVKNERKGVNFMIK